jgi:hypothetical protein
VQAAQGGDRLPLARLHRRYARMVHGILLARVPRVAAEDLLQDVFLQALPRLGSLGDRTTALRWDWNGPRGSLPHDSGRGFFAVIKIRKRIFPAASPIESP